MRRRDVILASAAALAVPFAARALQKMPVVGLLWNDSVKPSPYIATFLAAMGEKGYTAGRNFRVEDRVAIEGYGPMADSAAALVRAAVDVIVTYGATATLAAAKATKSIPIVMVMGRDPVAEGLAASLARPGGNVTGVATLSVDAAPKRFELLKELSPDVSKVGVLAAAGAVASQRMVRDLEPMARTLKLQPYFCDASAPAEIEVCIAQLAQSGAGAIYVVGNTMLASHSTLVVGAIAKHRLPAVYSVERHTDAGALMTYGPSVRKAFVRLVGYVDRILKGARPGDLPIEQVSDVELVVNLKTANALGIKIPQTILVRADRVIE
jgi:putative tryptophan/tyrosine transport system substrate-binding protein